jgi:hypothetical protein
LKGIKGHECKMKGTCVQMKGKWRKMNANANECKMKGKCCRSTWNQQNNSSLFRNWFWLHVGSLICWFPQNTGKR